MVLILLSIVSNVLPLIILPLFYKNLPENIPAFVDLWGNPVVLMEKSYIAIFRLPIMGILLLLLCTLMYFTKVPSEKIKLNKVIWSVIAFIGSLKMGLTSLEVMFYENINILKYYRIAIFVLVIIGIIILVYGAIKLSKSKIPIKEYKEGFNKNKIWIIGLIVLYIVTALMPMYYKGV